MEGRVRGEPPQADQYVTRRQWARTLAPRWPRKQVGQIQPVGFLERGFDGLAVLV